jgi:cellulose synthase/poly-beta-1,6-N-acetylglucosamine synthase-like glycosyltransferase
VELAPIYLLVLLVFTNRYVLGRVLRLAFARTVDRKDPTYEPTVSFVVPMFNEGKGIARTIASILAQEYPAEKLRVVVVDDCSTDDSYEWACRAAPGDPRVTVLRNPENRGKRRSINHAVREATTELIVSVDSDVIVDPRALRTLVSHFVAPDIAAVGGRVCVTNCNENWLTQMQTIKYFFGYEYLKGIERSFRTVMCLSGCLTAYRRSVLLELDPILEDRNLLGVPIKYGEDRFLTRQIVKAGYRTVLTLDAYCYTVAPNTLDKYFSQQIRWRRSNLIDYLGGISHIWRVHPVVATHYLSLAALLVAYPVVLATNILDDHFLPLTLLHLAVLGGAAFVYWCSTRHLPEEQRVPPLSFLAMGIVMPVTYLLFTPLAAFTLDSGSWETRAKPVPTGAAPAAAAQLAPAPEVAERAPAGAT